MVYIDHVISRIQNYSAVFLCSPTGSTEGHPPHAAFDSWATSQVSNLRGGGEAWRMLRPIRDYSLKTINIIEVPITQQCYNNLHIG